MSAKPLAVTLESPTTRLLLALGLGILAAFLIYHRQEQYLLKQTGGERHSILIIKVAMAANDRVEQSNLDTLDVPESYLHPGAIPSDAAPRIIGRKLYRDMKANQPLLWTDFESTESERAASSTSKGFRAAVVPLNESLAKSRLLSPGDFIDILVNLNLNDHGSATVTLLQRVKILELIDAAAIVQVTPEQAEKLLYASQHGAFSLVVRNREDEEQRDLPAVSAQNLMHGLDLSEKAHPVPNSNVAVKDSAELLRALIQAQGANQPAGRPAQGKGK